MAMKNEVNLSLLVTVGVVSALLLVVSAIAVDGWYKSVEAAVVTTKWDESPNTWLINLRTQQRANLNDGHRIGRSRHYRLSIDDAMKVMADHNGKISE
jgi:hypothetical protein